MPRDCRCSAPTEARFSSTALSAESFHLNGQQCVSKSNGLHKTSGHKNPWVCWLRLGTLFVFYSLSMVLFTALFTRYRSRSGSWDSCWSVSGYTACMQVFSTEACIDKSELDMGYILSFFIALFCQYTYYMTFYSP